MVAIGAHRMLSAQQPTVVHYAINDNAISLQDCLYLKRKTRC